ncbi:hypothetical protein M8C21_009873, partial [Ambrosia artemisiifolia]
TEINYLGQLHHPNLVQLIGYCIDGDKRLLVYEFVSRGSLENHLFKSKVALGAAKGLAYLHSPEANVIYRDFKCSNILIDSDYNAKLSDFGLAKDGPVDGKSHVSTRVMGTYGYAAPEYMASGHLTERNDIYSFGVVLLEILTGRPCIDKNRPSNEKVLVDFAKPYLTNKRQVLHIMDRRINGQYDSDVAMSVAALAKKCLAREPKCRPTANELVEELEQLQEPQKGSYDYNAKLSDFGLAKDGPLDGKSHVSTRVMGTYGYAAPEYMATGHLTERSDIYSFGVVLLEILTGRRCIDKNRPSNEQVLVDFAKPYLCSKRRVLHIMDQRLVGQYSSEVATRAAVLAMKCLSREPKYRPTADELVNVLEQLQKLQKVWDSCRKETGRKHNGNKNVGCPRQLASRGRSV